MDLYEGLPEGKDGANNSNRSQSSSFMLPPPSLLKPRAAATSHLMPAPKRMNPPPPKPRSIGSNAIPITTTPSVSASSTVVRSILKETEPAAAPIQIHATRSSPRDEVLGELEEGEEPYDPSKPNDYMEFCEERLERKKEEERQRELEKYLKERGEEQSIQQQAPPMPAPAPPVVPPVGRGRGRGVSNLPAWMSKGEADGLSSAAGDKGDSMPPSADGRFDDVEGGGGAGGGSKGKKGNLGSILLAKMGYKQGSGLGRDEQGITKAIHHRPTGGGQGTISGPSRHSIHTPDSSSVGGGGSAGGAEVQTASEQPKRKKRGLFTNPTKVVLLKNMVGPGEVDDELQVETAEECQKHGAVSQCLIYEVKDESYPVEERVRIFVAFERQESAVKAYVAMNGRFFAGRQVQASFFDEDRFAQKDLAPKAGE